MELMKLVLIPPTSALKAAAVLLIRTMAVMRLVYVHV
jgi:hypothetical protein